MQQQYVTPERPQKQIPVHEQAKRQQHFNVIKKLLNKTELSRERQQKQKQNYKNGSGGADLQTYRQGDDDHSDMNVEQNLSNHRRSTVVNADDQIMFDEGH